jgi:Flp pilus assembly secretin CpaC
MDRLKIFVKIFSLLLIVGGGFWPTTVAAERLKVNINKTQVIELNQPAAVVSIANPKIADVTVQSPRLILVIGKAIGETTIHISHKDGELLSYDVFVSPSTVNKVTVNLGASAVQTLQCLPRCILVGDSGSEPKQKGGSIAGVSSAIAGSAQK